MVAASFWQLVVAGLQRLLLRNELLQARAELGAQTVLHDLRLRRLLRTACAIVDDADLELGGTAGTRERRRDQRTQKNLCGKKPALKSPLRKPGQPRTGIRSISSG